MEGLLATNDWRGSMCRVGKMLLDLMANKEYYEANTTVRKDFGFSFYQTES